MFIKLRNYQDDGWVVVNTDYIVSMEKISGGSIITTVAKNDYKDPKYQRTAEYDKVNQRVFTCEELEDVIELVSKFARVEGTGVQETSKVKTAKTGKATSKSKVNYDDDKIPF